MSDSRDRSRIAGPLGTTGARRRGAMLLAVVAALALVETDRAVHAGRPGELAQVAPSGALLLLEADDLPALAARWRDCDLRDDIEATKVHRRCTASRLGLRLAERRDLFEAALSAPLSLDRLAALPGDRGGIALYNVGETTFVMWLRTHHGAGDDLQVLSADLSVRRQEREGQAYVVHRGGAETMPVAFAVVGDLLIISNDIGNFERALDLARTGGGDDALAADEGYRPLLRGAPASAQVHLYLDMGRLLQTRQFQRYWVHDNAEELVGLDRALLSVEFRDDETVEHRQLTYAAAATRMPSGPSGGADVDSRLAALPDSTYAALRGVDHEGALDALRWVWPDAVAPDGATRPDDALRALLKRGGARQVLEVLRPRFDLDGFAPADQVAVAVSLSTPAALSTDDVLTAGAAAMARTVRGGESVRITPRRSHARGVTVHTVAAPLPGQQNLIVSRARDGAVLVFSTTPGLAAELASGSAAALTLGQALATVGADVARLDFPSARRLLSRRLDLITTNGGRRRSGAGAFLGEDVPELLTVPELIRIDRSAARIGDIDHQIVRYVVAP